MTNELEPCPFCGCKYGQHESDCYIYMLATHERFDAINHGTLFTDDELEKAWNTRYKRTCTNEYGSECTWLRCSECGAITKVTASRDMTDELMSKWCGNCGAEVVDA